MRWLVILSVVLAISAAASFLNRHPTPQQPLHAIEYIPEIRTHENGNKTVFTPKNSDQSINNPCTSPAIETCAERIIGADKHKTLCCNSSGEASDSMLLFGIRMHNGEWFLAFFTAILAIATIFLSISTQHLVKSGDGNAERQLRAHVHIVIDKYTSVEAIPGSKIYCGLGITNSGRTPAHHVWINSNICVARYPLEGNLPEISEDPYTSKSSFYPQQKAIASVISETKLTKEEYDLLSPQPGQPARPSNYRYYVYGVINYIDEFNKARWTKFRLMSNGLQTQRASLIWCDAGNEAQ